MEKTEGDKLKSKLKVIGAGLPRTGTMSLYTALGMLGYSPVHHFKDDVVMEGFPYTCSRQWQEAMKTEDTAKRRSIIRALYDRKGGYEAAVDYPTSAFVGDLVEMYPDAKFVHGIRSSPQAWRKSFNSTLGRVPKAMVYLCYLMPHQRMSQQPIMDGFQEWDKRRVGAQLYGDDDDIEIYKKHNEYVRRVVPKERLLEFEPKMGFKPLCEFLGVPVPRDGKGNELAYPHTNDTAMLNRTINFILVLGVLHWIVFFGLVWWVYRLVGSRL